MFALIGRQTGILDQEIFSVLVSVVILTTFIAPLGLRWSPARVQPAAGDLA